MDNIFIAASRNKLRFETSKGYLTTEDLWDLSLSSLDNIAKAINRQLKDSQEESFIKKKSNSANSLLELALEVLKTVINTKQEEADKKAAANQKKAELETLKNLLQEKKGDELKGLSASEIEDRIKALETEE